MKHALILASTALALIAGPAFAGSSSNLQAELDALRAEVDALSKKIEAGSADKKKFVQSGGTGIELKLSGQVNRGVLFLDDGDKTETFFVDNDNSSTRFRFTGSGALTDDVRVGMDVELEAESNSTADINQNNKTVFNFRERQLRFWIDSKTLGRLTVGQGSMASDGTSEVDLSGTTVVAYSGIADLAGGFFFFDQTANALTGNRVGNRFNQFDGLSRQDNVRYDSPRFAGFTVSTSVGDDGRWDVALRTRQDFGDFRFEAAAAHANDNNDNWIRSSSASVLHKTSGISLTGTISGRDKDNSGLTSNSMFYYVKAGWQTKALVPFGTTAFSIDYSRNEDTAANNDKSTSYGIAAVQNLDKVGTELYVGARKYKYNDQNPLTNLDDIIAVLVGARVKF